MKLRTAIGCSFGLIISLLIVSCGHGKIAFRKAGKRADKQIVVQPEEQEDTEIQETYVSQQEEIVENTTVTSEPELFDEVIREDDSESHQEFFSPVEDSSDVIPSEVDPEILEAATKSESQARWSVIMFSLFPLGVLGSFYTLLVVAFGGSLALFIVSAILTIGFFTSGVILYSFASNARYTTPKGEKLLAAAKVLLITFAIILAAYLLFLVAIV